MAERGRPGRGGRPARRGRAPLWIALAATVLWGAGWIAMHGVGGVQSPAALGGLVAPVLLIAIAALLAARVGALRSEARDLRSDLSTLRAAAHRTAPAPAADPEAGYPMPRDTGAQGMAEAPAAQPLPRTAPAPVQPDLPLDPSERTAAALTLPDLIRALHFPETPDDRVGLRALARALRHHKAGLVVTAAQDMLTLLSQDGIYVDDLAETDAAPETWRFFADGDRAASSGLACAADAGTVARCRDKLRANTVFRDTAHHFLRRFDQLLADMVPQMSDDAVAALTATRSARAFRLMGSAAGIFGPA